MNEKYLIFCESEIKGYGYELCDVSVVLKVKTM